jgi:hypothetical protein
MGATACCNGSTDSGIAALCADNYAVEAYPADQPCACIAAFAPCCLFKLANATGRTLF